MTEVLRPISTKDKVLQLVASHGVPLHDVEELRDVWGPFAPPARELTRILWDLQKQGEIKFNEIKAGRDSLLTKIRLSRGIDTRVFSTNESRRRHPVGRDLTDPQNHHWIAKGGPIERSKLEVTETYVPHGPKPKDDSKWVDYVSKVHPDRVRPILPHIAEGTDRPIGLQRVLGYSSPRITTLVTRGEQLGWLTREKILANGPGTRAGVRLHLTEEGTRLAAEPFTDVRKHAKKPADTPQEYPDTLIPDAIPTETIGAAMGFETEREYVTATREGSTDKTYLPGLASTPWPKIIDVVELEKYPYISELMTKEAKLAAYEAAAALLEGFDQDLALTLLEKIQISPLEKEVIAFVSSLR